MGADFEGLLLLGGGVIGGFELELGAAAAFVKGLHPEGFGDVGDGLGQAMQGGGTRIQPRSKVFPPDIQERTHGIRGPTADGCSDSFHRGTVHPIFEPRPDKWLMKRTTRETAFCPPCNSREPMAAPGRTARLGLSAYTF